MATGRRVNFQPFDENSDFPSFLQQMGGGQPNSTQIMPMPILRFECGIGINWHKLAHFFDSYICVCYTPTHANFTILAIVMMCFESNQELLAVSYMVLP